MAVYADNAPHSLFFTRDFIVLASAFIVRALDVLSKGAAADSRSKTPLWPQRRADSLPLIVHTRSRGTCPLRAHSAAMKLTGERHYKGVAGQSEDVPAMVGDGAHQPLPSDAPAQSSVVR